MGIRLLGLTGGIATGKSTVSRQLADKGAEILCADSIYHQLISPDKGGASPLAEQINEAFPGVLSKDGTLNRHDLGSRVFGDQNELNRLAAISHPAISIEVQRQVEQLEAHGAQLVFYDVALLFEQRLEGLFEGILVVWVPEAIQLKRLMTRENIALEEAQKRVNSQLPIDFKKKNATWVIDNSGSPKSTTEQVDTFWQSTQPS